MHSHSEQLHSFLCAPVGISCRQLEVEWGWSDSVKCFSPPRFERWAWTTVQNTARHPAGWETCGSHPDSSYCATVSTDLKHDVRALIESQQRVRCSSHSIKGLHYHTGPCLSKNEPTIAGLTLRVHYCLAALSARAEHNAHGGRAAPLASGPGSQEAGPGSAAAQVKAEARHKACLHTALSLHAGTL